MPRFVLPSLAVVLLVACNNETTISDASQPSLTLRSPAPAEWLAVGSHSTSGDWQALSEISVNGMEMSTTGTLSGAFSGDIEMGRGITVVAASGVDQYGDLHFRKNHVLAGEFTGPRLPVDDAAIIRVNESGLDTILMAVEDSVDSTLLASLLVSDFPIYEGQFLDTNGDGRGLFGVDLFIDGVELNYLDLDATLGEDEIAFQASIYALDLTTTVTGRFADNEFLSTTVLAEADRIDITGTLTMSAYQGELDVQLLDSDVDITGFYFDIGAIPGNLEGSLSGVLEGIVENQVGGLLETQITGLMRDTLSAFDLSFETEILGKPLSVEASFSHASIDPAGIELGMDVDVDLPSTTTHPYTGVLTAPGAAPSPDANADVSLSLWDDMLNKVLFEAWRAEMLVQELSSEDGSLTPIALLALHADSAVIQVDGKLPPVVVQDADGNLEAQIGELEVIIDMEGSDLGSHLEVAVAIRVDVDMDVVGGVLDISLGRPELDLMVRDGDWGASNEATSELLLDVLPIDLILSLIGDLSFPLPDLPGLTMNASAGRDGNGTHTSVQLSLSQTGQ